MESPRPFAVHPAAKLMSAVEFAAIKHRQQTRRDPDRTPFVNHPIRVATILAVEAAVEDEEVLIAALLHDTVEDTDTTFEEIESKFGKRVCNMVREVTDDKLLAKDVRKQLQIDNAGKSTHCAKLIKLADKLDNLRDLVLHLPEGWTEDRRERYFAWSKNVVDKMRGTNAQMEYLLDKIFYNVKKN